MGSEQYANHPGDRVVVTGVVWNRSDQSLLTANAMADFLLAAWLAWMTPLVALVELTAGRDEQLAGLALVAGLDGLAEVTDGGAKGGANRLVASTRLLIGLIALDLRFDVCHASFSSS